MNILLVMTRKMYPIHDGGQQGIAAHYRMLNGMGVDVYGVMSNVNDDCEDWREHMPEFRDLMVLRRCHPQVWKKPVQALWGWGLSSKPRQAQVIESKVNRRRVMDYIKEKNIAVVLLEGPFGAEYIDFDCLRNAGVRIVVVEHNVEYIYQKEALSKYGCLAKPEISRTKKYEKKILPQADAVITVSPTDRTILEREFGLTNVDFLPIPMERPDVRWKETESEYIIFNGSLNSYVNYYSMKRFCKVSFPRYIKRYPEVKLFITGGVKDSIRREFSHENIEFTGFLSERRLRDLLCFCRFMISPIIIGSGTKLKLIEGLSMGIPIVASEHCFEGVPFNADNPTPYLVASKPEEYLQHMERLTDSMEARGVLSEAAAAFYYDTFVSENNRRQWARKLGIDYGE